MGNEAAFLFNFVRLCADICGYMRICAGNREICWGPPEAQSMRFGMGEYSLASSY